MDSKPLNRIGSQLYAGFETGAPRAASNPSLTTPSVNETEREAIK